MSVDRRAEIEMLVRLYEQGVRGAALEDAVCLSPSGVHYRLNKAVSAGLVIKDSPGRPSVDKQKIQAKMGEAKGLGIAQKTEQVAWTAAMLGVGERTIWRTLAK